MAPGEAPPTVGEAPPTVGEALCKPADARPIEHEMHYEETAFDGPTGVLDERRTHEKAPLRNEPTVESSNGDGDETYGNHAMGTNPAPRGDARGISEGPPAALTGPGAGRPSGVEITRVEHPATSAGVETQAVASASAARDGPARAPREGAGL